MKALGHVFKYGDNVDTDVIIPARYLNSYDAQELASHAMADIDPEFVNTINIGLPIIECPEAAKAIEAGDEVEIDFDSGKIYDRTKGTEFQGQPFPEFMQKLIAAGGLVKYTNSKRK